MRLAEENCLARAVYFEARSESELGQLAVAKVILNRVKDPNYPNTICGVVYQGSNRRNSCQFSFACDGLPDDVRQPGAWAQSKQHCPEGHGRHGQSQGHERRHQLPCRLCAPALGQEHEQLVKIGRHIFYDGFVTAIPAMQRGAAGRLYCLWRAAAMLRLKMELKHGME